MKTRRWTIYTERNVAGEEGTTKFSPHPSKVDEEIEAVAYKYIGASNYFSDLLYSYSQIIIQMLNNIQT